MLKFEHAPPPIPLLQFLPNNTRFETSGQRAARHAGHCAGEVGSPQHGHARLPYRRRVQSSDRLRTVTAALTSTLLNKISGVIFAEADTSFVVGIKN